MTVLIGPFAVDVREFAAMVARELEGTRFVIHAQKQGRDRTLVDIGGYVIVELNVVRRRSLAIRVSLHRDNHHPSWRDEGLAQAETWVRVAVQAAALRMFNVTVERVNYPLGPARG